MASKLEITEYYELVALHKALRAAKFARDQLIPALPGSPYLADISRRVVETLNQMEVERGKPERASWWSIEIVEGGEIWQIAVRNAAAEPEIWNQRTRQQKCDMAHIFLSPFTFTDEMIEHFVQQVNSLTENSV